MTQSSQPTSPPPAAPVSSARRPLPRWVKPLLVVLGLLGLATAGGMWWLWRYVQRELAPIVETQLGKTLQRPLQLGKLEGITPTSIRFGPSTLPATDSDPDRATVQAIDVTFNPLSVIQERTLRLGVTLVKPNAYIEQSPTGSWVDTRIKLDGAPGPVKIELQSLAVKDAELMLVPRIGGKLLSPLSMRGVDGSLEPKGDRLVFKSSGKLPIAFNGQVSQSPLQLEGDIQLPSAVPPKDPAKALPPGIQARLKLKGQDLLLTDLQRLAQGTIALPLVVEGGRVDADLDIQLGAKQPSVNGTIDFKQVAAKLPQLPLPVTGIEGRATITGQRLQLDRTQGGYGPFRTDLKGSIDLNQGFLITGKLQPVAIGAAVNALNLKLPVAVQGLANADWQLTGAIAAPRLIGQVRAPGLVVDKVSFREAETRFDFSPKTAVLGLSELRATPASGGVLRGSGEINLGSPSTIKIGATAEAVPADDLIKLYGGNLQGSTPGSGFRVGPIAALVGIQGSLTQPQALVRFQAPNALYPSRGVLTIDSGPSGPLIKLQTLSARVAGGIVRAKGQLLGERWAGSAILDGVQLARFDSSLRGQLNGSLDLSGPLNFSPERLLAQGNVQFSQGIAIVQSPLTANVRWNRNQIVVEQATAQGLQASGTIGADLRKLAITNLNLAVKTQGLRLASLLPNNVPDFVAVKGLANFDGQIQGTPATPQLRGQLQLQEFALNRLPFASSLTGSLAYNPGGTSLNLAGGTDQIQLTLDPRLNPQTLLVRQGDSVVQGQANGDRFRLKLAGFALAALNIKPQNLALAGPAAQVDGQVSADLDLGLRNFSLSDVRGSIAIDQPSLGSLRGDRLETQLLYDPVRGIARLENGEFTPIVALGLDRGSSLDGGSYRFGGQANLKDMSNPILENLNIDVDRGEAQDVLRLLQWFDLKDLERGLNKPTFATADRLDWQAVGQAEARSLWGQLTRLSAVRTEVQRTLQQRRDLERIPPLTQLAGRFNGQIGLKGSLKGGLTSSFAFKNPEGSNWTWGDLVADRLEVTGDFKDNRLTFQPVQIAAGGSLLNLTGSLGLDGEKPTAQLTLDNMPIDTLRRFVDLPVTLQGQVNVKASLGSEVDNPRSPTVQGTFALLEGKLNGTPIQLSQDSGFNYLKGRAYFGGSLLLADSDPVNLRGNLPIFAQDGSTNINAEAISINLDVKDKGLAFLNLLTQDQLRWIEGEGQVNLAVGGVLGSPIARGQAIFKNATLSAQILPDETLSQVSGNVQFEGDLIRVDGIQGVFSKGNVIAKGSIPISKRRSLTKEESLAVGFRDLSLNLRGLYRGGASGDVVVLGTALKPQLTGTIALQNGQVILPDNNATALATGRGAPLDRNSSPNSNSNEEVNPGPTPTPAPGEPSREPEPDRPDAPLFELPTFQNLELRLVDRVIIATEPVFSFSALGTLQIDGDLNNPQPRGEILLTKGKVNLFTTAFSLLKRSRNTAIFRGTLDPELDVRMVAALTEVKRRPSPITTLAAGEIADVNPLGLGELQTVRVQARVRGLASNLLQNITLSSSPARSETEIVSLMGGGFVDTLGRGGSSTFALANLAGSALLTNVQTAINNVLGGAVELRIFPLIVESTKQKAQANSLTGDRQLSSSLALGGELAVNLTNSISFSALKLLTVDLPTQFNLRYQVNDNLTLRATTDLQGDNRAVVEYEARF
jgi:translocation and assembly module TamB